MKFCDNLRRIRKHKKISQEELAEKVGVSRQSVSKWECAESYPEMDNILKLCDIFHCKINDLVQEDLIDIDSLGEDVKMSVVKFKKEKQRKMKGLSKAIYTLAKIGKVITIIGIIAVLLTMIVTPVLANNVKVENNKITIFGEEVKYKKTNNDIRITIKENESTITDHSEVYVTSMIIDKIENGKMPMMIGFIETAFVFLTISLALFYLTLKHLEKMFINIHNGTTPFTMENVSHIKKMATFMILTIILPNIAGVIAEMVMGEELGIGFEMFDVIYILFLFSMAYVFEYGYQLQLDSKGKMYGENDE